MLQVKTIGPSHRDPKYSETRQFYARCGFFPIEESTTLWAPHIPCLLPVTSIDDAPESARNT